MIWALIGCYIGAIAIIAFSVYYDMNKGETVKEYMERVETEELIFIAMIPLFNCLVALIAIVTIIVNKIKHIKK